MYLERVSSRELFVYRKKNGNEQPLSALIHKVCNVDVVRCCIEGIEVHVRMFSYNDFFEEKNKVKCGEAE